MSPDDHDRGARGRGRGGRLREAFRGSPVRGRRVRRTVRHVDPWSVLKLSLLFFAAIFLIICVASGLLWSGARASGQLGNVEHFITSVGGFGNCEPVNGADVAATTTTTINTSAGANQIDPTRGRTGDTATNATDPVSPTTTIPSGDQDCGTGEKLVGEFKFDDLRIFEAFAFGGVVLVLAGTGASVVLALLFNLMSDLTGGVQVTVVEDDAGPRRPPEVGSPPPYRRG